MSEKRVYQDKMLNSKKEIVVCNWERGDGKTYSIFKKIMEDKNGKYLYISPFEMIALRDYFKEYAYKEKDNIKLVKDSRDRIFIEFNNGNILEVFYIKPNTQFKGHRNIKIAFADECYLDKYYIDTVLKPMDVKQVYIMITSDKIEYIDNRNKLNIENFYDKQIEELMIEYSNVVKNERTTLTREKILQQIHILQEMKKKN